MLNRMRACFRLLAVFRQAGKETKGMKFSTGLVGLLIVAALQGVNSVTGLVTAPKWHAVLLGITVMLGAILQVLAQFSNPDGTSANLPNGLTPEQLEQYRKMFIQKPGGTP